MYFIFQEMQIDLGDTPIENIFINDYMPQADGTYVKVYLMGYNILVNSGTYAGLSGYSLGSMALARIYSF